MWNDAGGATCAICRICRKQRWRHLIAAQRAVTRLRWRRASGGDDHLEHLGVVPLTKAATHGRGLGTRTDARLEFRVVRRL